MVCRKHAPAECKHLLVEIERLGMAVQMNQAYRCVQHGICNVGVVCRKQSPAKSKRLLVEIERLIIAA